MTSLHAPVRLRGPLAALAAAAAGATYVLALRPWLLRWGATTQEAAGPLPGDDLVPVPRMQSTRAVTIAAPVSHVWPWLIQLGAGRGGMYSYDWLEDAVGLGICSADRILPEFQQLRVGDSIPLAPDVGLPVRLLDAEAALGLGGVMDPRSGKISASGGPMTSPRLELGWTFVLRPVNTHTTRLLSRTRYDYAPIVWGVALRPLLEPVQFLMERRMLLGIRSRAEGRRTKGRAAAGPHRASRPA